MDTNARSATALDRANMADTLSATFRIRSMWRTEWDLGHSAALAAPGSNPGCSPPNLRIRFDLEDRVRCRHSAALAAPGSNPGCSPPNTLRGGSGGIPEPSSLRQPACSCGAGRRRAPKNPCIRARQSCSSTPATTSTRWFRAGCSSTRMTDRTAPAFGSGAP